MKIKSHPSFFILEKGPHTFLDRKGVDLCTLVLSLSRSAQVKGGVRARFCQQAHPPEVVLLRHT